MFGHWKKQSPVLSLADDLARGVRRDQERLRERASAATPTARYPMPAIEPARCPTFQEFLARDRRRFLA